MQSRIFAFRSSLSAMSRAGFLLAFAILCVLIPDLARAQTAVNAITSLTGDVNVIRAGSTIPATQGMQVMVGDHLKTGPGANVTVTLTDGTKLELGESGEMVIDKHTVDAAGFATTRIGLALGVLRSLVAKTLSGPPPDYEVHTPNAVAAARGTVYDVGYQTGTTRSHFPGCSQFTDVAVYDGAVGVSNPLNPGSAQVQVDKGYQSTVPCALLPTAPVLIGAVTGSIISGTSAAAAGGVAGVGGVVGGLAGAGAFGGSPTTQSPSQ
jgi:FecR protein